MGISTTDTTASLKSTSETADAVFPVEPHLKHGNLPDKPLVTIKANSPWQIFSLKDLWVYRELLYFLMWRDLKVRYKQTILGVAWVVFQPILMTIIFSVVLGRLAQVPSDNVPYLLFAYAGLVLWTFFSSAILTASNSLIGNANLVTKVYFPRVIIPLATVAARLVDLAVALVILTVLMFYFQVGLSLRLLLVPFFILLLGLLALAVGMWTAAVNVKYRDVGFTVPVLVQLWMFASPVVYPLSLIPKRWQLLYSLDPLVGIIEGFRAALFGTDFYWPAILISAIVTPLFLLYAAYEFQTREKTFADII